jgi:mannose-6-phosphate isomerase
MLLTSLIYRSSSDSQACRDHWAFCMQIFPEILQGVPVQPYVRRYSPPSDEFEVDCCFVPPGEVVVISSAPSLSIFLVLTGEGDIQVDSMLHGEKAKEGDVFFVPSNTEVKLSACVHASMQLYRAGVSSNPCMSVIWRCKRRVPSWKVYMKWLVS